MSAFSWSLLFTLAFAATQKLSCPVLTCSDASERKQLDADLCFERDMAQPVFYLNAYGCDFYSDAQAAGGVIARRRRRRLAEEEANVTDDATEEVDDGSSQYQIFSNVIGPRICELEISSGEFAWFTEDTQIDGLKPDPANS